jgi:ankyrin repeat protein
MGDTCLHSAAWGGNIDCVSALLSHAGIDANIRNKDGQTPAELAKNDACGSMLIQFARVNPTAEEDFEDDD